MADKPWQDESPDLPERIDWELQRETQRQKNIANQSKKKHKRSGCTLPHEYLTKKEREALNGEFTTYKLRRRIKWEEFKEMPKEIQVTYLQGLVDRYGCTFADACLVLNISSSYAHKKLKGYDILWNPAHAWKDTEGFKWLLQTGEWLPEPKLALDITKPVTWAYFCRCNFKDQIKYLADLKKTYGIGLKHVSEMFKMSISNINRYFRAKGIDTFNRANIIRKQTDAQCAMWEAFLNSADTPEEPVDIPAEQSGTEPIEPATTDIQGEVCEFAISYNNNPDGELIDIPASCGPDPEEDEDLNPFFMELQFDDVKSWDQLRKFLSQFKIPDRNRIRISIHNFGGK